jgi:hypothetical protein
LLAAGFLNFSSRATEDCAIPWIALFVSD